MPTVTVIVPTFNSGSVIQECLDSVMSQSFGDLEIIVVDVNNGSQDNTQEIIEGLRDPHVKYIRQTGEGLANARNTALAQACGNYVALLDADDSWLPGKLQCQVTRMAKRPDLDVLYCDALKVNEFGRVIGSFRVGPSCENRDIIRPILVTGNWIHVSTVLLRRSTLERVGGFDETSAVAEDLDLWLRMGRLGYRFERQAFLGAKVRIHSRSMLANPAQVFSRQLEALDKFYASPDLTPDFKALKRTAYATFYYGFGIWSATRSRKKKAWYGFLEGLRHDPFSPIMPKCGLLAVDAALGLPLYRLVMALRLWQARRFEWC
jgi:glycosyltransferase involved in cell wall biosynthesis